MKTPKLERTPNLELLVVHKLRGIGVPAHIRGYGYLKEAVVLVLENPDLINQVTQGLYFKIAKEYETTPSRVERNIRHAVEVVFDRANPKLIKQIFGEAYNSFIKVTNSEFIATIAEHIREDVGVYGQLTMHDTQAGASGDM